MKLRNRTFLLAALLLAAIGLFILDRAGLLTPVEGLLLGPITSVQDWVAERFNVERALFGETRDVQSLQARNAELERQVAELQAQVIQLKENEAQLAALSALLDYARTQPENRYVAADVIGRDESPFLRYVILNKGTASGVAKDMPVVSDQGLVGQVVEAVPNASKVVLITDPSFVVNARLQIESRDEGVVTGQLTGDLRMQYLSLDAQVEPGTLVITSGLGGLFPTDILIGQVASVRKRTYDLFQEADLTPAVDFDRLEIVLVITNFTPVDLSGLNLNP